MARDYSKINEYNKRFTALMEKLYEQCNKGELNLEGYYDVLNQKKKSLEEEIKDKKSNSYKTSINLFEHNLKVLEHHVILQRSYLKPDYPIAICAITYLARDMNGLERKIKGIKL